MGLKEAFKKQQENTETKPELTTKLVVDSVVDSAVQVIAELKAEKSKEPKPILKLVPSKGVRQTENANFPCDACGKFDILTELGKVLLCSECSVKEAEAIRNSTPEVKEAVVNHPAIQASIEKLNPEIYEKTLAQIDVPIYAKGKEDRYTEFFNRDYDIDKMSDEQLRDSIIEDGNTLFEVKVRQQKKIISLKERLAKKTEKEREKFRLDDLTYKPDNLEESPLAKPKKTQKEKALDSLKSLGLDSSDLSSLLARFAKKEGK
jgi:hypothetical protein